MERCIYEYECADDILDFALRVETIFRQGLLDGYFTEDQEEEIDALLEYAVMKERDETQISV